MRLGGILIVAIALCRGVSAAVETPKKIRGRITHKHNSPRFLVFNTTQISLQRLKYPYAVNRTNFNHFLLLTLPNTPLTEITPFKGFFFDLDWLGFISSK